MFAAFRLLPLLVQLGFLAAGVAAIGGVAWAIHHHIWQQGYDAAVADVAQQNQEAVDAVNEHRGLVRDCNLRGGMRWDQVARQCVRRD